MSAGSGGLPPTASVGFRTSSALAVGVLVATLVAWGALLALTTVMPAADGGSSMSMDDAGMGDMAMSGAAWSPADALLMLAMWLVMMVAMMLPSAYPMLRAYDHAVRADAGSPLGAVMAFAAGYLLCWGAFAVAATVLQWWLTTTSTIDAMGALTQPMASALVLIAAGVYELTPVKQTMLGRCRAPVGFLATEWRDGRSGALRMGIAHGRSCLACCWAMMLLLFVLGVMNLWWVLAVACVVALEKMTRSPFVPRIAGVLFIAAGLAVLVSSVRT